MVSRDIHKCSFLQVLGSPIQMSEENKVARQNKNEKT